ncbi:hypothetical protein [Pedobacter sp. MC2016-24]|uniref:hypothetical protein n=1 Tax=Pedobacter sp. MC2016-24 TaxID=2780090 RepID=UPI00188089DB|nr:hypothetical protein [Pedobacter sp. MC2016-24]MBE9602497.1 hypothetical protein [Pedobacter sp. MC2016-24]
MNKSFPIILELETPQHPDDIFSFIKMVLAKILDHKMLDIAHQQKIKMILVELITNSIKHSADQGSQIKLVIDQPSLSIQKFEKGLQIEFSASSQQIPFEEVDKILKISFSEENNHHIQPLDRYKFKFLNPHKEGFDIEHMPEHFGFYIITIASDSFIYQYDPEAKENRYIVNLNI